MIKTVKIDGRLYSIDPRIYEAVLKSLAENPVETSCELKERIDQIRIETQIPAPLGVQLANVGLSNYTKRYSYVSAGSKKPTMNKNDTPNRVFDAPLKTSSYAKEVIVFSNVFQSFVPLTETNQWSTIELEINEKYASLFPSKTFSFNKSQLILIAENSGCSYTGDVKQLFPGGTASVFGTKVLTTYSITTYFQTGDEMFTPVACTLTPTNGELSKVGILMNFVREGVAIELIFIPAESDLDRIQNVSWGSRVGLEFAII